MFVFKKLSFFINLNDPNCLSIVRFFNDTIIHKKSFVFKNCIRIRLDQDQTKSDQDQTKSDQIRPRSDQDQTKSDQDQTKIRPRSDQIRPRSDQIRPRSDQD